MCIGQAFVLWMENVLTDLLKAAISSLKDSDEQTSAPCIFWSLGVHVANSHFSNTNAKRGKSGWLKEEERKYSLAYY